jgi:hypothetical protein
MACFIFLGSVARSRKVSGYRHADDKGERNLITVLDGVSGHRHAPIAHCPRERTSGTHCIGGWLGLRTDLNTEAKGKTLCLFRGSNAGRPVCRHYTD